MSYDNYQDEGPISFIGFFLYTAIVMTVLVFFYSCFISTLTFNDYEGPIFFCKLMLVDVGLSAIVSYASHKHWSDK